MISADQLLLDRIVNEGIDNRNNFLYLSESSSGDGKVGTDTPLYQNLQAGTDTPLYQNLQATISEVRTRRTERSINELHSNQT